MRNRFNEHLKISRNARTAVDRQWLEPDVRITIAASPRVKFVIAHA